MLNFAFVLALMLLVLHNVRAICNVCNPNGVACISEQEFHFCLRGEVNTSVTFSCLGVNEICTDHARVCVNKTLTSATKACGIKNNCGKCYGKQDDGKFSCTSRTTFTMCSDGNLTQIHASCPENYLCSVYRSRNKINPCVRRVSIEEVDICNLYDAIDATTPQPITTTTQDPAELFCSQQSREGRYPYPGDVTLTKYIYCFRRNGVWRNRVAICPKGMYFNQVTLFCQSKNGVIDATTQSIPKITQKIITPTPQPIMRTTQDPAELFCSQQSKEGRYPYPGDTTLKRYINCFRRNGVWRNRVAICPKGMYFNQVTLFCESDKGRPPIS